MNQSRDYGQDLLMKDDYEQNYEDDVDIPDEDNEASPRKGISNLPQEVLVVTKAQKNHEVSTHEGDLSSKNSLKTNENKPIEDSQKN